MEFGLTQEERAELGEEQRKRDRELINVRQKIEKWAPELFVPEYMQVYLVLYFEVVMRKLYSRGGQGGVSVEMTDKRGIPAIRMVIENENLSLREVYGIIERERGEHGNISLPKALSFMDDVIINPRGAGGVEVDILKQGVMQEPVA